MIVIIICITALLVAVVISSISRRTETVKHPPVSVKEERSVPGRWSGYTFKRVCKSGNFFSYQWVLTDRRISHV